MIRAAAAAALVVGLVGAAKPARAAPPANPARAKEALFGDARLVPTREGERARRELALAGAIAEHLAGDPQIRAPLVDVTLPERDADPAARPHALVSLQAPADAQVALRAAIEALCRDVLGDPQASVTILRRDPEPAAPAPAGHLRPLLALALLGLGASAGVVIDRRRRAPRRSRG
ncbi:MAG: hypothetical protein R3A79_14660 [Nannocystaceae bacterium]